MKADELQPEITSSAIPFWVETCVSEPWRHRSYLIYNTKYQIDAYHTDIDCGIIF